MGKYTPQTSLKNNRHFEKQGMPIIFLSKGLTLYVVDNCGSILSIPYKKAPKKTLSYFSKEEIAILKKNFKHKRNGLRHYVLLLFMYETAARAQEICDLTKKQIHIGEYNYIILKGKGNKETVLH